MKTVAFESIIDVVFRIVNVVVVAEVNCEGPTLKPAIWIIIVVLLTRLKVLLSLREESWSLSLKLLSTLFLEFGLLFLLLLLLLLLFKCLKFRSPVIHRL